MIICLFAHYVPFTEHVDDWNNDSHLHAYNFLINHVCVLHMKHDISLPTYVLNTTCMYCVICGQHQWDMIHGLKMNVVYVCT